MDSKEVKEPLLIPHPQITPKPTPFSLTTTGAERKQEKKSMRVRSHLDLDALKLAALARLHDGEPETLPTREQLRTRVYWELAETGLAVCACPDHPLARQEMLAVQHEVVAAGWQAVYELLPALAETYPLHVLIVCAVSLTGPAYTLHSGGSYYTCHRAS